MKLRNFALTLAFVFVASLAAAQSGGDKRRTGYQDMSPALQQMEDDDTSNPGMLFVQAGEALWKQPAGKANKACADCHGAIDTSMKGVAAPTSPSISKAASIFAAPASSRPRR